MTIEEQLAAAQIVEALEAYHLALDQRANGNAAAHKLVCKIENILGRPWVQGAALARDRLDPERE